MDGRDVLVCCYHGLGDTLQFNPGDDSRDVQRTARLIAGLDLVVTVDTMVAHLAGTLGAPTWPPPPRTATQTSSSRDACVLGSIA